MACYFVYGTLGAGKGIFLSRKMKEYIARGSRVATNVDLFPEKLCPNTVEPISRVPSIFRLEDLEQLGRGCPPEEKKNLGGLFLDEGALWLNARDWNAKGRKELIHLLIMIRKLGWDIYIAIQDPESTDKQALGALGENFICCSRLDHFRIPVVSDIYDFYRLVKSKGREQSSKLLPHINKASYRYGKSKQGNKPYRKETYRPKDFFGTYDTNQIFEIDQEFIDGRLVDMRAPFSYIPGKTLKEWYMSDSPEQTQQTKRKFPWLSIFSFLFFTIAATASWALVLGGDEPKQSQPNPQTPTTQQSVSPNVSIPQVPDYLDGAYISGYVLWKDKKGNLTYDYAIHDKHHRSFDVSHYAVTVTPAAPCIAWLTTHDNINVKITCSLKPQVSPDKNASGVLAGFNLGDMAKQTMEAI